MAKTHTGNLGFRMMSAVVDLKNRINLPAGDLVEVGTSENNHHICDKELTGKIEATGLFKLHGRGKKFTNFIKDGGKK